MDAPSFKFNGSVKIAGELGLGHFTKHKPLIFEDWTCKVEILKRELSRYVIIFQIENCQDGHFTTYGLHQWLSVSLLVDFYLI